MNTGRHALATERLKLEWLTGADAALLLAVWNDPDFVRFVGDRGVRTLADARRALLAGPLAMYEQHGYGPYRVALADDGRAIGVCGLFRRPTLDDADIGYALLPDYVGRGYATEAARAVLADARDRLHLERVIAIVSPDNDRSIRLLEKLGLRFAKMLRIPGDDSDVALYQIEFET